MKLNQKISNAASKLMETITKGYYWYHDTPEQPFEYSEGSIWLINPETEQWILELTIWGELWYDYETPDSFYKYLNMERHDFESFIKTWMEDALKRGVSSTIFRHNAPRLRMEDALNRGVSSTIPYKSNNTCGVEDVLNRGVVSIIRNEINWDDEIKDVLENGVVATSPLARVSSMSVQDAIENGKQLNRNENVFKY